jgi:hypothetical protein
MALKIYTGNNKALVGLCALLSFQMKTAVHRLPIHKLPNPNTNLNAKKNESNEPNAAAA